MYPGPLTWRLHFFFFFLSGEECVWRDGATENKYSIITQASLYYKIALWYVAIIAAYQIGLKIIHVDLFSHLTELPLHYDPAAQEPAPIT